MAIDIEVLTECAKQEQNVLLIGTHGVGKTMITKQIFDSLNYKMKYYSAATLDPWADLVGIPVPVDVKNGTVHKELQFIRPQLVDEAEVLFFDELNRAHPKVLNAVMEIIQFKSINGVKLPKLKMVWAAINPPGGEYKVNDLDPALADRFQVHLEVLTDPSRPYLVAAARDAKQDDPAEVVTQVLSWWSRLDPTQKKNITPRRLEYLCRNARKGIPLSMFIPWGTKIPVQQLEAALKGAKQITYENLYRDTGFRAETIRRIKNGELLAQTEATKALLELKYPQVLTMHEILEALPPEARARVFSSPTTGARLSTYVNQYYPTPESRRAANLRPEMSKVLIMWEEYMTKIQKRSV